MVDVMGELVRELRADAGVSAIVGTHVWGEEVPANAGNDPRPFVTIRELGVRREKRTPVMQVRVSVLCVAKTHQLASALYGAVSDALHNQGPRVNSGVGIWRSSEESGGQTLIDPQLRWPQKVAIYEVFAVSQAVA